MIGMFVNKSKEHDYYPYGTNVTALSGRYIQSGIVLRR